MTAVRLTSLLVSWASLVLAFACSAAVRGDLDGHGLRVDTVHAAFGPDAQIEAMDGVHALVSDNSELWAVELSSLQIRRLTATRRQLPFMASLEAGVFGYVETDRLVVETPDGGERAWIPWSQEIQGASFETLDGLLLVAGDGLYRVDPSTLEFMQLAFGPSALLGVATSMAFVWLDGRLCSTDALELRCWTSPPVDAWEYDLLSDGLLVRSRDGPQSWVFDGEETRELPTSVRRVNYLYPEVLCGLDGMTGLVRSTAADSVTARVELEGDGKPELGSEDDGFLADGCVFRRGDTITYAVPGIAAPVVLNQVDAVGGPTPWVESEGKVHYIHAGRRRPLAANALPEGADFVSSSLNARGLGPDQALWSMLAPDGEGRIAQRLFRIALQDGTAEEIIGHDDRYLMASTAHLGLFVQPSLGNGLAPWRIMDFDSGEIRELGGMRFSLLSFQHARLNGRRGVALTRATEHSTALDLHVVTSRVASPSPQ